LWARSLFGSKEESKPEVFSQEVLDPMQQHFQQGEKLEELVSPPSREEMIIATVDTIEKNNMQDVPKIIKFLEAKKRVPSVINLTNPKKMVVKFGDKF
jgi:hypothetical protein